jgi:hypothetical protein
MDTASPLLLRYSSWLGAWGWGLLLIVLGTAAWIYRGGLECDRSEGLCTLGARDLPGVEPRRFPLHALHAAEFDVKANKDSANDTSRVLLQVGEETLALGIGWSGFNDANLRRTEHINAFIADPAASRLRVHASAAWLPLVLLPFGALVILLGRSDSSVRLDRGSGRYTVRRRGVLRRREQLGALADVSGTLIVQRRGNKRSREQLGMLVADGRFVPLGPLGHGSHRRLRADASRICAFLGLAASRAVEPAEVAIGNREALALIGSAEKHREEADRLRAQLEATPDDVEAFRRLAICLMRLERRQEAADILRSAYRHFAQRGEMDDANRVAAVLHTLAP